MNGCRELGKQQKPILFGNFPTLLDQTTETEFISPAYLLAEKLVSRMVQLLLSRVQRVGHPLLSAYHPVLSPASWSLKANAFIY